MLIPFTFSNPPFIWNVGRRFYESSNPPFFRNVGQENPSVSEDFVLLIYPIRGIGNDQRNHQYV